jgi:hypothetical protein
MVAGVDKDTRSAVEAQVRAVLSEQPGSWSASVVSLAGKWSVTLDGPDGRNLSFVADGSRLVDAIRDAISGTTARETAAPAGASSVSSAPAARSEARDQHTCEQCGQPLVIVYERRGPDESQSIAPVACPTCWKVGHYTIGSWAAVGSDYKAEKA